MNTPSPKPTANFTGPSGGDSDNQPSSVTSASEESAQSGRAYRTEQRCALSEHLGRRTKVRIMAHPTAKISIALTVNSVRGS